MAKFNLTIVIPTYNEGDIIEGSLKRVAADLGDLRTRTEIVIADDGSDNLPEVVNRSGKSLGFGTLRVIRNGDPLGKGISIQDAFHVSQGAIVGFIDVDFSVAPSYVHDAIREIRAGADICIGSRVGNRFKSDNSLMTSLAATAFAFAHRMFIFGWGRSFPDTQCGFKFFRREAAVDLYQGLVSKDGLTDLEVLVKAVKQKYKVVELKVPRINDRQGKRKLSRIFRHESVALWKIFLRYRLGFRD